MLNDINDTRIFLMFLKVFKLVFNMENKIIINMLFINILRINFICFQTELINK
jgi:hypothetical protein